MARNSMMTIFRVSNYLYKKRYYKLSGLLTRLIRIIYSCELPASVSIGEGTLFVHNGLGVVIHPKSIIGDDCRIYQNVTLGGRHNRGTPIIGNRVLIGAGACILGGVTIGDDTKIGANSVVVKSVDKGSVIVGIPGRDIRKS